jgi:hypothetical protein
MVSCKKLADNLSLYIADEVSMELRLEIERHLSYCRRCEVLLDSVRKVLIISGDERTFEIPAGYEERLHSFLDQHL